MKTLYQNRAHLVGCALIIIAVVCIIRFFMPFEFPIPWNDETAFTAQAYQYSREGNFFVPALNEERTIMWMPPGYMVVLAGFYKVFGYSFDVSRWVSALFFIGSSLVGLWVVTSQLSHYRRALGGLAVLIAFLSPFSLITANIARMESLYTFIFLCSMAAGLQGRFVLGSALVLLAAVVHFNAVYFVLPFFLVFLSRLINREKIHVTKWEFVAALLCVMVVLSYVLFVSRHYDGFLVDMAFQFQFKNAFPFMGGQAGVAHAVILFLVPVFQVLVARRVDNAVFVTLFGFSFVVMTLAGNNMWYSFGYNVGYCLMVLGLLMSCQRLAVGSSKVLLNISRFFVVAALFQLCTYFNWQSPQIDPLKPSIGALQRDFIPEDDIVRIKKFIRDLPEGSRVSFGYTGVEQYFFEDFANSAAQWTISAHSVTQVMPPRKFDYRVHCDSAMIPAYLGRFDWDGYQREGIDYGCRVHKINSGG